MTVRNVQMGSSFRVTFVASGATANPISFSVLSGSESMVHSWAGVDSGNGLYYADVRIDSPGLWQGAWHAYISPNSYRASDWYAAFPTDTDQPGRYITWDDVVNRYQLFGTIAGAVKAASHYLRYVEGELDSRLGVAYSVPFSNNNITIRDLAVDMVYLRSIRFKTDGWKELKEEIDGRIAALNSGTAIMVVDSGDIVVAGQGVATSAWSNNQDYHPVFAATLDWTDMVPSSAHMQAEADERGI